MANKSTIYHVAVMAFPFGTHAVPILTLAQRLSSEDPSILFSFLSTPSNISSLKIPENFVPFEIAEEKPSGEFNVPMAMKSFSDTAKDKFKAGVEKAEKERGVKVSCLLTDAFLWFCNEVAAELGVAWLPYWTSGASALSLHLNTDLIRNTLGENGPAKKENQTLSFLPGLSAVHVDYLPEGVFHGDYPSPVPSMLHKMGQHIPKATAVVVNSYEELEPEITQDLKSKLKKVLNVGPSLPSPNNLVSDMNYCIPWLDEHKSSSVAYISFGTVASPRPDELQGLAEALQDKKTPFIWSIRDHMQANLPKEFVKGTKGFGKIVSWAPQAEILAHPSVGVFITHCGWNSVSESIIGGVPLICRPFFGDQKPNSVMVQDVWKIGFRVKDGVFTKSGTIKALETVMSDEDGKKMRENVGIIKKKAMKAVGPNGSSAKNFLTLLEYKPIVNECSDTNEEDTSIGYVSTRLQRIAGGIKKSLLRENAAICECASDEA